MFWSRSVTFSELSYCGNYLCALSSSTSLVGIQVRCFSYKVGELSIQNFASLVCVCVKLFRYDGIFGYRHHHLLVLLLQCCCLGCIVIQSSMHINISTNSNQYNISTWVPVAVCFLDTFSFYVREARGNCSWCAMQILLLSSRQSSRPKVDTMCASPVSVLNIRTECYCINMELRASLLI